MTANRPGGRFDGAFGVLAALEVLEVLQESSIRLPRPVMLVAWMNEEGGRFAPGMMGSEVFRGIRSLEGIRAVQDAEGITVGAELDALGFPQVPRIAPGFPLHAYIEPHIEQADTLERANVTIGAVTGIQGKKTYEVTLTGREAHAGTEPMDRRVDALQAFARVALAMEEAALKAGDEIRFTIGRIEIQPNAPSVVPACATFRIDLRHPSNEVLNATGAALQAALAQAAPCAATLRPMVDAPANEFTPALRKAILRSAEANGFPAMEVLSAAGHDARHMAPLCPSAMIFIPCKNGLSHHPGETATPEHVAAGAQVLLDTCVFASTRDQGDLT